nr:MAG TPA: hypothetical protein [Caudoviricetes sp.]
MNAKDIIECNACHVCDGELYEGWRVGCDDLIFKVGAEEAVKAKEEEMRLKAIEAYIENCEYKSDRCCGCTEARGAILSEPNVCMGRDCPYVKGFIEKLNS